MKRSKKSVTSVSPGSRGMTKDGNRQSKKAAKDEPRTAENSGYKIDRPGFDLGGSSGDTHAGTGVGLGNDASDTAGDRRLPGRRPDNKLTIPRWRGSEPSGTTEPAKKPSGRKT